MRVVKRVIGLSMLIGGGFLSFPLVFSIWLTSTGNEALPPTVKMDGREFVGWQMWTIVGGLALFGALLMLIGCYVAYARTHWVRSRIG